MYPSPDSSLHCSVVVLFSEASRAAYATEAVRRGDTYTFPSAWDRDRSWLKGEWAYLAPNAACAVLNRCNLKHDLLEEAELLERGLDGVRALVIPNAGGLRPDTIDSIQAWVAQGQGRLLVTGKTNLPDELMGLASRAPVEPAGYTGWRWLPGSPFGDRTQWEPDYVTGYRGYTAHRVGAAAGGTVLADLVAYGPWRAGAGVGRPRRLGAGIVRTERTCYIANEPFELLGGALQAHLNVEDMRRRQNPVHWGDTIALFLRSMLLGLGLDDLWETRLRSFGSHAGAFSYRQDVHGHQEYSFLDYEVGNLVPATFCIEDPALSTHTTPGQARLWAEKAAGYDFVERGLHNDSVAGGSGPGLDGEPEAIHGKGLYEHVAGAEKRLGFPIYSCGRHGGGHLHPETLDAMDYLYANYAPVLGMCTFSFYHMVEYGVRRPDVEVAGRHLTYATEPDPTIATPGFWFPYHAAVTAVDEWRVLRGWDRTHDFDCGYDLLDRILAGRLSRVGAGGELENPVYSLQYHPEYAVDPSVNDGRGTLSYLRYALALAERKDLWIANERQLYQRMSDYQDVAFEVASDGSVRVYNPTGRTIAGLAVERRRPFGSVWEGDDELVHVVQGRFATVPPLAPGQLRTLRFETRATGAPRVAQPGHPGLEILEARHNPETREILLRLSVCRRQSLLLHGVDPRRVYEVMLEGGEARRQRAEAGPSVQAILSTTAGTAAADGPVDAGSSFLRIAVAGEENRHVEQLVRVRPARDGASGG